MYKRVYVWELPVRILHWVHVVNIFVLALTGIYIGQPFIGLAFGQTVRVQVTDWVRLVHFVAAYVFGLGFLARLYWFFAGNQYANWRGWVPVSRERWIFFWRQLKYYLFLERERPQYLGHNPVSGLSYLAVGVMILAQGITGLALYSEPHPNGFWRVTFGWLTTLFGDPILRLIHHGLMYLFGIFLLVHLYMAVLGDVEEGNAPITSIISGIKFERVEEG
jgi:Ni/Fe-hydrogenase 1 B-type cytochrome subunit